MGDVVSMRKYRKQLDITARFLTHAHIDTVKNDAVRAEIKQRKLALDEQERMCAPSSFLRTICVVRTFCEDCAKSVVMGCFTCRSETG